ncbi:MAG TPA: HAMP domain-containing protein, partial [Elusimicrobiota bacterium]|nr:HAMP domain-containing protein [Elusimicrobiota bacterium]
MPSGILARFLRSMAGLALAPALVMGLLLLRATRSGMQEAVLELQSKLAETSARRIAETLRGVDSRVGFVRTELTRPSLDWRAKQDILKGWLESEPEVEEVSLLRNGREILRVYDARSVPPGRSSRAADPAYRQLRRTGRRALRMIPRAGAPTRLEAYYPLAPGADLRVGMSLRSLWGWLTGERVGGTGYVVLLGPKGEPIIYSPLAGLEAGSRSAHWPVVAAALQARTVGSTEYEDLDGRMQVAAYAPVPEIGGAVLVQQSRAQAYAAALRMQRVGAMILIVVCALALLVAAAMARSMTGPLLELTRAAERVSAGEFPEAAVVATGDELQGLADTFARMVARLKGYAELQVDRLL